MDSVNFEQLEKDLAEHRLTRGRGSRVLHLGKFLHRPPLSLAELLWNDNFDGHEVVSLLVMVRWQLLHAL